jgi:hypothetical protein
MILAGTILGLHQLGVLGLIARTVGERLNQYLREQGGEEEEESELPRTPPADGTAPSGNLTERKRVPIAPDVSTAAGGASPFPVTFSVQYKIGDAVMGMRVQPDTDIRTFIGLVREHHHRHDLSRAFNGQNEVDLDDTVESAFVEGQPMTLTPEDGAGAL